MRARSVFLASLITLLPIGAFAKDDSAPLILKPSSTWQVHYAEDSCRLGRKFGQGDQRILFYIERFQPEDHFFLLVAGAPLERANENSVIRFGPAGFQSKEVQIGELGEVNPALISSSFRLIPYKNEVLAKRGNAARSSAKGWREEISFEIMEPSVTPEEEDGIRWLEVEVRRGKIVRLMLGKMGAPMKAMRACTDELMTRWGLDIEAHRELSRRVTPASNPDTWMNSKDYPPGLLAQGAQGIVHFRLNVGPDGKPSQCHIQRSTRPLGFDQAVCQSLMRRARFDPALDRTGKPISSYWQNSVRSEIGF